MAVLKNKKNRVGWLDMVKGVTVIMVAMSHSYLASSTLPVVASWVDYYIENFNYFGLHVRMSTFFFSGGIVFSLVKGSKLEWFFKKRLPFMLWIILIWTLISFISEKFGLHLYPWCDFPYFAEGNIFLAPYGNLWFIFALLIVSFFAAVIESFSTIVKVMLTVIFSYFIHLHLTFYPPEVINDNGLLLQNLAYKGIPFFMLGVVLSRLVLDYCENIKKVLLFIVIMILLSFCCYLSFGYSSPSSYAYMFSRSIPATFSFIGILVLFSKVNFLSKSLGKIGSLSLEIFITHEFFIALYTAAVNAGYVNIDGGYSKLVTIFSPILICIGFVFISLPLIRPILFTPPKFWSIERLIAKRTEPNLLK